MRVGMQKYSALKNFQVEKIFCVSKKAICYNPFCLTPTKRENV